MVNKADENKPIEFKSFIGVPDGGQGDRCYYAMKIDTYGRGCQHGCTYCYAKYINDFRGNWNEDAPAVADIEKIRKIFVDVYEKDNKRSKWYDLIKGKQPIRLGGMTDCFTHQERRLKVTYELLKIFKEYQHPYLVVTKNNIVAYDEYLEVLDKDLAYIQFSITTPFDDMSKKMEPKAIPTSARLKALKTLSENGFFTAVRVQPLFPIHKDGYYSQGLKDDREFRYFDWSLIDMVAEAGGNTLMAGIGRMSSWNLKWTAEQFGYDIRWLFPDDSKYKRATLYFSTEEKRYYYERIKKQCDELGLQFTICFDDNDEYENFRYLWTNPNDCCNGQGNIKGFTKAYDDFNPTFIR